MDAQSEKFFLGRQPILDRNQDIIGFELLFRSADVETARFDSYSQACSTVIKQALDLFGIQDVLGGKIGFINVPLGMFLSELLELLPIEQTALELLEIIELNEQVVERCRELKKLGFTLALDDHVFEGDNTDIYGVVDIIKIDILLTGMEALPTVVRQLRKYPVKLLAEKVETAEQFQVCYDLGFELFQGYFFARPTVLNRRKVDVSQLALLKLLQQLSAEASLEEIELTFKENPGISYNLLKLVNSVSFGLRVKIKSLRHAILQLGFNQLRRWIQLSLFAGNDTGDMDNPLLELAAVRGRMMEGLHKISTFSRSGREQADGAFMVGIVSLLDVLLDIPLEEIVTGLNLSDDLSAALLKREGELGTLLLVAEKLEVADFSSVAGLLDSCGVSLEQLLMVQVEAFSWRYSEYHPDKELSE